MLYRLHRVPPFRSSSLPLRLLLLVLEQRGIGQCVVDPIEEDKELAVVVHVGGVVVRVVLAAHDGLRVPIQRVMYTRRPYPCEEEHGLQCPEVAREEEGEEEVGASLQHAVHRVEGQASKGAQVVIVAVDVVIPVQVLVEPPILV